MVCAVGRCRVSCQGQLEVVAAGSVESAETKKQDQKTVEVDVGGSGCWRGH